MLKSVVLGLIGILLLTACGQDQSAEEPLRLPARENTWVKTEQVEITKHDVLSSQSGAAIHIPINEDLQEQLMQASGRAPQSPVADTASCLALLEPLDTTRMAVQREGGAWAMFERSDLIKPYSNNGMQIDSNLNRLVFSLRHLCRTA